MGPASSDVGRMDYPGPHCAYFRDKNVGIRQVGLEKTCGADLQRDEMCLSFRPIPAAGSETSNAMVLPTNEHARDHERRLALACSS